MFNFPLIAILVAVPLYPKFPLLAVPGTFVSIRLEDIFIAFIVGLWLVYKLQNRQFASPHPIFNAIVIYWLVGFVATFSGITVLKMVEPQLGLLHWARRIQYLILFAVGYDFFRSKSQLPGIIQAVLLIAVLTGIYGLGQLHFGWPIVSTTNSEFSKGLAMSLGPGARINSTFAGHYDLAAFSLFPLLLLLGLMALYPKRKIILAAIGLPIYLSMLISASRVNFVALFFTAGLFLIFIQKKNWLVPLVILMLISFVGSPQLIGRYRELIDNHLKIGLAAPVAAADSQIPDALQPPPVPEDRSFNIRIQASWPRALRSFQKNPLIGTGFSSVGLAVDNGYLRLLAETGLIGALAFCLLIFRVLKPLAKMFNPSHLSLDYVFFTAIHFAFIGLLLNALFIDIFEASKIAVITWLLVGIAHKSLALSSSHASQ